MVRPAFVQFCRFFDPTGGSFSTATRILSARRLVGAIVTPVFGKLGDLDRKERRLLAAISVDAVAVSLAGLTPRSGAPSASAGRNGSSSGSESGPSRGSEWRRSPSTSP
ncbi:MAG: hypothetical protein ACREC5_08300 [Thermoplasmata archaeon]